MADVKYEHNKTGQTATYPQPNPRLEKSDDWKRVAKKKKSGSKSDGGKS